MLRAKLAMNHICIICRAEFFLMVVVEYAFLLVVSVAFLYTEESTRRREFVKCVYNESA